MGLSLYPSQVKIQSRSMISALEKDNEILGKIQEKINAFVSDDTLKGDAWYKMKQQLSNHSSVIMGLSYLNNGIIGDCNTLINTVGDEILIEDQLRASIWGLQKCNWLLERANSGYYWALRQGLDDEVCNVLWWCIQKNNGIIGANNSKISDLQNKLDRLLAIEQSTAGLFSVNTDMTGALNTGVVTISGAWLGLKLINTGINTAWKNTVTDVCYEEAAEKINEELGEEALSVEEYEALDNAGKQQYLEKVNDAFVKLLPSLDLPLTESEIRIPLAPGLTAYYKLGIDGKTNPESVAEIKLAREDCFKAIQEFKVGTIHMGADGYVTVEATINLENRDVQVRNKYGINPNNGSVTVEYETECSILNDNVTMTNTVGIEANPQKPQLVPEPVPVEEPVELPAEKPVWEQGWEMVEDGAREVGELVDDHKNEILGVGVIAVAAAVVIYFFPPAVLIPALAL